MILVILMLASVLSSIDVYELQEQNEFEETGARSGADAEIVYVTSPRETIYATGGGTTNELLAGEPVNFKAYLRNSGDADLTNMQYQVTVYDDDQGERGDVAQDINGNDLAWNNDKAVCSNSCQNSVLTPGEYIDGGESTLVTTAGNMIEWVPFAGNYFVEVTVTSQVLGDPGNDEISFRVSVVDYHDIEVDLTWLDADGEDVFGSIEGTNPVDFKVSVSLEGSMVGMTIRNTTIEVDITGGTVDNSNYVTEILGDQKTVDITDDGNAVTTTGTRMIIGADDVSTTGGRIVGESIMTLTPPADGVYDVSVSILSYTVYELSEDCPNGDVMCERTIAGADAEDKFSGNNMGYIYGSATTVHDITLLDFYLAPEVNEDVKGDENNEEDGVSDQLGTVGGEITQTLSNGNYDMYALVAHSSSSSVPIYEWNVTFTVTDVDTNTVVTYEATECEDLEYPTHGYLGVPTDKTANADTLVYACASHVFDVGEYVVEATANMNGEYDEGDSSLDAKTEDMVPSNNDWDFRVTVDNFAPIIASVKPSASDVLVGDSITFESNVFDVEDDRLEYFWYDGFGNALCELAEDATSCTVTAAEDMVPMFEVRLEVTDSYNVVDFSVTVEVMVELTFQASGLADGFNAVYTAKLKSSSLDVTFADGPMDSVDIDSCANSATPVGSVTVNPSTTYDSSVVSEQTMHVHFPNDLGVQYMWMEAGSLVVSVASGAGDEIDSSTSGYTYSFPAGSDLIPSGTNFYLIADDCETPNPPAGTITQLTATAAKGGEIVISYEYSSLLSDENVRIEVTMADGTTPEVSYDRVDSDTRSITWASGTDGQAYTVTAQLCNVYACGDSVPASVTSDSSVAAVTAASVTISESGENWVVAWEPSAVDEDVAGWYVCYNRGEFTATEMKVMIDANACTMVMQGTEATIAKYTTVETTQVHFGIAPHDAVMNIAYGPSTDSILYDRAQDTTNPDDGTTTTDSEASSGVPTWTWGVIGAVVVVAFVVGAFILSRGEGEDDDDKEWDY